MDMQETLLKITDYDEVLSLRGERILLVTDHKEIFSLDETHYKTLASSEEDNILKKRTSYEEDANFFDYIKYVELPKFDLKQFFNYKQKRISSKRAKENLHSKELFPLVSPIKDNLRPRREKLLYCQSEIFPSRDNSSSFFRRWHNFSLPRFTIYRVNRFSLAALRFDKFGSITNTHEERASSSDIDFDFENVWKLNNVLNREGHYEQYCLKSHLRQHMEDKDILELYRIYTAGLKKAPQVHYDPKAEITPSLKYVKSLEVLEIDKAIIERRFSVKPQIPVLQEEAKKRDHVKFEQKPSILPDFRYTGEEQFRVIVYDDEEPYLDFQLDKDKKKVSIPGSEESILKLVPDLSGTVPEIMSESSLIGMGDYRMKPGDINKPVMLKFKNMPELLGWFRKINEKDLMVLGDEPSDTTTNLIDKPKTNLREVVVQTPMVGLKRFRPLDARRCVDCKKLDITNHDTILSIIPRGDKKNELVISDSDPKEEACISMETVVDKLTSQCMLKKKGVTYKTKSSKHDSLQRIKSSIVNDVVKKLASYFSKDLKPKLEASIKDGQCKCCHNQALAARPRSSTNKPIPGPCMCGQKKPQKVSKGVSVDLNELSSDMTNDHCPTASCRPNFSIFACPSMNYFRNTGVSANTIGSSGDSLLSTMPFDCQKMLHMYENLARDHMKMLNEFQKFLQKPENDVKFCKTINADELGNYESEDYTTDFDIPADFSSHVLDLNEQDELLKKSKSNIGSEKSKVIIDYMLESCSSSESVTLQNHNDILNVKTIMDPSKSHVSVSKTTSYKMDTIMEDTCNIDNLSDFECYINYICTHSEHYVQIPYAINSKKLKRQTSLTSLIKRERSLTFGIKGVARDDADIDVGKYKSDLMILFKRNCKKRKITKRRNRTY